MSDELAGLIHQTKEIGQKFNECMKAEDIAGKQEEICALLSQKEKILLSRMKIELPYGRLVIPEDLKHYFGSLLKAALLLGTYQEEYSFDFRDVPFGQSLYSMDYKKELTDFPYPNGSGIRIKTNIGGLTHKKANSKGKFNIQSDLPLFPGTENIIGKHPILGNRLLPQGIAGDLPLSISNYVYNNRGSLSDRPIYRMGNHRVHQQTALKEKIASPLNTTTGKGGLTNAFATTLLYALLGEKEFVTRLWYGQTDETYLKHIEKLNSTLSGLLRGEIDGWHLKYRIDMPDFLPTE